MPRPSCVIDGCNRTTVARGWCQRHYRRWERNGDPTAWNPHRPTPEQRFWSKVDKNGPVPACRPDLGPCWNWSGFLNPAGYGRIAINRVPHLAHRYSYSLDVGPIPDELEIDHLCRNRGCVRPTHLEPVTHRVNVLRGETVVAVGTRRTHCPKNHPFSPENTWRSPTTGHRRCRTCQSAGRPARRRATG